MNLNDLRAFQTLMCCDFNPNHGPDGRFTSGSGCGKMSKKEVRRVSSGILTDYPDLKEGEHADYFYGKYYYQFNVNGPGDYDFLNKMKIIGNEEYIKIIRGSESR